MLVLITKIILKMTFDLHFKTNINIFIVFKFFLIFQIFHLCDYTHIFKQLEPGNIVTYPSRLMNFKLTQKWVMWIEHLEFILSNTNHKCSDFLWLKVKVYLKKNNISKAFLMLNSQFIHISIAYYHFLNSLKFEKLSLHHFNGLHKLVFMYVCFVECMRKKEIYEKHKIKDFVCRTISRMKIQNYIQRHR